MAQTQTHVLESSDLNQYLFQVSEHGVGITHGEYFRSFSGYCYRFVGHYTREEARQQWKRILSSTSGGWHYKK